MDNMLEIHPPPQKKKTYTVSLRYKLKLYRMVGFIFFYYYQLVPKNIHQSH